LSDCTSEVVTVGTNKSSISTSLSETTGAIGDTVHDSALLSGVTSDAGGTVTYTVYSNDTCTTSVASGGTKTVTNGVVPDSNPVTFNSAGTFYWQAAYSGDGNNASATSACKSEVLVIGKNSPGATTAQSLIPNDAATLTGAAAGAGGRSPSSSSLPATPRAAGRQTSSKSST